MARGKSKNPRKHHIDTRLTLDEFETIKFKAKSTGITASEYLRSLGMNYPLKSMVDQLAVDELIKARADLGRLGGLFKKWLVDNDKTNTRLGSRTREDINTLVESIEKEMEELKEISLRVMRDTR